MLRETITLGRPFGVRVEISLTWLIVCAVVAWSLGAFYFPSRFPGWSPAVTWLAAGISSLVFFLSVVVHELAHAVTATRLGVQVRGISLFLFGGVTQFKREAAMPATELKIALVGPGVNILVGLGCLGVQFLVGEAAELLLALCVWTGALNLALGLFNLLPWLPLDGGRILRALAWYVSDDRRWANRVTLIVGQLGSAALIFAGVAMIATHQGGLANAIWTMLVGWFIHSSAVASYQTNTLMAVLDGARVDQLMVRRLGRIERDSPEAQSPSTLAAAWGPEYYVVTHNDEDLGVFAMSTVRASDSPSDEDRLLQDVLVPLQEGLAVPEDSTAMDALRAFMERDLQWAPVLRDREVVGVIRRVDLAEYLEKHRGS
jgi:Zn-dependent protease